MSDYLDQLAAAKVEVARLKGEKEAFEQSNEPDGADEEELKNWNYANDLERQIRELKSENREALKELAKLEKAAAKLPSAKRKPPPRAGGGTGEGACLQTARDSLKPVFDQIAALEAALAPYEQIKRDLAAARTSFRKLTDEFVSELKNRCGFMGDDKKRAFVLELIAQDACAGLDNAVSEKRQLLSRLVEELSDKYSTPMAHVREQRELVLARLETALKVLGYAS